MPIVIIGGGPGGYVAGIRAGQLGLSAIVIDDQPLGGTCLNVGCIPSKALIHAAEEFAVAGEQATDGRFGITVAEPRIDLAATMAWKDGIVGRLNRGVGGLLRKAGTEVVSGRARLVDGKTVDVAVSDGSTERITADHIVLATGSAPVELASLPFGGRIISSTGALSLTEVPDRLAVVGGGYIGLELGMAFANLGASVTVVEAEDRILPLYDRELVGPVAAALENLGVTVLTDALATEATDGGLLVSPRSADAEGNGGSTEIPADNILVTVGRTPAMDGLGLDELGLTRDGPFVAIDERCRTSMRNVWAIGDLTGEPMLAHRAMKQGEVVAEVIAGQASVFDPAAIPAVVFTDPEIVSVGLSPDDARSAGLEVIVGRFPLQANGRAMTLSPTGLDGDAGLIRAVANADDHLIVGLQAVGTSVAELSAAFGLALEMGARLEDVADTIHTHPTVGEGFAESVAATLGHPLHI